MTAAVQWRGMASLNMPIKLQRSPLAMSSALDPKLAKCLTGYQMTLDVEGVVDRDVC
jgi:hypothetical protein